MTNRTDAQAGIDALTAKQGVADSVTPANLAADQLQVLLNSLAAKDDVGTVDYNHGGGAQSLAAETFLALNNDGAGAGTNTTYLPSGVTSMLSTNQIDASQLKLGDWLLVRSSFRITPATNNQAIDIRYTLGTGANSYTLEQYTGQLRQGAGIEQPFSQPQLIYMGDANTRDNTIGVEVRTSGPASIQNEGFALGIIGSNT